MREVRCSLDPLTTMNVKVAVVVLLVIAVLFVGALAVGCSQNNGSPEDRNGIINQLGEAAGDPAAVPLENLTTDCTGPDDPRLLVFTIGCTIVARNDNDLRVLRLQPDARVVVSAPAPEADTDVDAAIKPNRKATVAIGEGETQIGLSCRAGFAAECRVRILE